MSSRRRPNDAIAARDTRRRELLAKLSASSGLTEDDLRVETLSWMLLALDTAKRMLLRGELVDISPWQQVIEQLTALLPGTMVPDEGHEPDYSLLTDTELDQLGILVSKSRGVTPPTPEPVSTERERGPSELTGATLGAWIDSRDWTHPLAEGDKVYLRNMHQSTARAHFVVRDLWASIIYDQLVTALDARKLADLSATPAGTAETPPTNVVPLRSDSEVAPHINNVTGEKTTGGGQLLKGRNLGELVAELNAGPSGSAGIAPWEK